MNELDAIDLKILQMLQTDARLTHKQLAAALDLTITPVFERVKKLERRGFIRGYVALLEPQKVDKGLIVFLTIRLSQHKSEVLQGLRKEVMSLPEVMECYHIAGEEDYLLKVMVRDIAAYERFLTNKLTKIAHISHVKSNFVMSVIKQTTAFEL
jgi:Lrp/AsnC family leucine-responsive transcriptional regulator